jgi:hypothetical protein
VIIGDGMGGKSAHHQKRVDEKIFYRHIFNYAITKNGMKGE